MPRYFSDLDNGTTKYIDVIGTELADIAMVPAEAIGFQRSVFRDAAHKVGNNVSIVSIRDDQDRVIYRSIVTTQDTWIKREIEMDIVQPA